MAGPQRRSSQIVAFKDGGDQTKDWRLTGIHTGCDLVNVMDPLSQLGNTDEGKLHVSLSKSSSTVTISVYKDADKGSGDLVVQGTYTDDGSEETVTLAEQNSSALSGTCKCTYSTDDADVYLLVSLVVDSDLYLLSNNLDNLIPEGFRSAAKWCVEASRQVVEWLRHRFEIELSGGGATTTFPEVSILLADSLLPEVSRIHDPTQLITATSHLALHYMNSRRVAEGSDAFREEASWHMEQHKELLKIIGIDLDIDSDDERDSTIFGSSARFLRA